MHFRTYQYQDPPQWSPPAPPSAFQTTAFAQSVFQRTAPSNAYPTPPPAAMNSSSSSLAFALGPLPSRTQQPPSQPQLQPQPPPQPQPQPQQQQQPPQYQSQQYYPQSNSQPQPQFRPQHIPQSYPHPEKIYQPQESQAFFDDFLERKLQQMNPPPAPVPNARPVTPPPKPKLPPPEESPDPLALYSERPSAFSVTPKKRKPIVLIESPSKRIQSAKALPIPSPTKVTPRPSVPLTPSTNSSSFSKMSYNHVTPTPQADS